MREKVRLKAQNPVVRFGDSTNKPSDAVRVLYVVPGELKE
jgi:hypothetical protein